ncbi:hypothetical protein [Thioalkalivibrio thiocyanodenitrificans]|uniref:hypothetical protein n=1 Tax=Thioalkalivibrio thiocyanodenitrificans TaxID=243063 RepID=UPI00035F203E|nr:hypothetical protein [Thioalkalivibrio thiocyanodenitrificans]
MTHFIVRRMRPDEAPALADLESEAWPAGLQASESMIRKRLELGHQAVVAVLGTRFIAAACFYHTSQDPTDTGRFPRDFERFSTQPASEPIRSSYVYSLCVTPAERGRGSVQRVVDAVIENARSVGARYVVGDGRCAAYAGAAGPGPDRIRCDPLFRRAIDDWHRSGRKPGIELLIRDPLLRFHHRLGCEFLHLAPDFLPSDTASGGFRVIFMKRLTRQEPGSTR